MTSPRRRAAGAAATTTGGRQRTRQSAVPGSRAAARQRQPLREQQQPDVVVVADREGGRLLTREQYERDLAERDERERRETHRRAQVPPSKADLLRLMAAEEWEQGREAAGLHEPISGYDPFRAPEYLAQQAEIEAAARRREYNERDDEQDDLPTQDDLDAEAAGPDYDPDYDEEHQVETDRYFRGRYPDPDDQRPDRREAIEDLGRMQYAPEDDDRVGYYGGPGARSVPPRPQPRGPRPASFADAAVVPAEADDPMAGMPPVPEPRRNELSPWVDLGHLTDERGRHPHAQWAGWCVRVKRNLPLGFMDAVEQVQLASWESRRRRALSGAAQQNAPPVLQAGKLIDLVRAGVAVWNFPDPLGRAMPQPFETGWERSLDPELLAALFDAIMKEVAPPKAGSPRSSRR